MTDENRADSGGPTIDQRDGRPPPDRQAASPAPSPAPSDVFISHASENKDDFVRPLAEELRRLGLRVWYDEWTLRLGDSLRQRIDEGLRTCRYAVVVLSPHFFAKNWPKAELDGLCAREMDVGNLILPVWHKVTHQQVLQYSPLLAGKKAVDTTHGLQPVVDAILSVVMPCAPPITPSRAPKLTATPGPPSIFRRGRYQTELGQRHRYLREKVLAISLRRMANFYGFDKAAQLEAYERGDDEFPTSAIKKLREFFFVSQTYLEEGAHVIFDSFDNVCSADEAKRLLSDGFRPYILCLNEQRDDLRCWPVLHKEQDGFDRIVRGQGEGYFMSIGGGKANIIHIIAAMQSVGLSAFEAFVLRITRKTWQALDKGTFYSNGMMGFRGQDDDCRKIFDEWWKEHTASLKK